MARSAAPLGSCRAMVNLRFAWGLCLAAALVVVGCTKHREVDAKIFVGTWKSSRLITPLVLHENGEWEIRQDDGTKLQYGIWSYQDRHIRWSYKVDGTIGHDLNAVVSATPLRFQLRERDSSITTFDKLGPAEGL